MICLHITLCPLNCEYLTFWNFESLTVCNFGPRNLTWSHNRNEYYMYYIYSDKKKIIIKRPDNNFRVSNKSLIDFTVINQNHANSVLIIFNLFYTSREMSKKNKSWTIEAVIFYLLHSLISPHLHSFGSISFTIIFHIEDEIITVKFCAIFTKKV